jgi:FkbM family methyltransferase
MIRINASLTERILLRAYRFLAKRLDLQRGIAGAVYRRAYFFYKAMADRALLRSARRYVQPGTMVLDVGANIGFFCRAIVRRNDAHVIAFEPDPANFAQLQRMLHGSRLTERVHAHCLALSDTTGTARLYLSDVAPTDHKLIDTRSSSSVDVEVARLDDFLSGHPEYWRPISLIKIDVQGSELQVLRGMRRTLERHSCPPVLVEYSPDDLRAAAVTPEDFFAAFGELGYRPHSIPDGLAREPAWIIAATRTYTNILMRAVAPAAR